MKELLLYDKVLNVKKAKATKLFWHDVKIYGGESQALRALDCTSREEAILMLARVQNVSVFKLNQKIVIQ